MGSTTHTTFLFLLFAVAILAKSQGDPYDNPSPPLPSEAEFPQSLFCNDTLTKCSGKQISCPQQCPTFKAPDSKSKGCFIDCNSKKCEAVCKSRMPNCNGIGSACYDPRFVGGDGVMLYFHGKTNEHFSLVSDTNLQINGSLDAAHREDHATAGIQALGLMFDSHSLTLAANKVTRTTKSTSSSSPTMAHLSTFH